MRRLSPSSRLRSSSAHPTLREAASARERLIEVILQLTFVGVSQLDVRVNDNGEELEAWREGRVGEREAHSDAVRNATLATVW